MHKIMTLFGTRPEVIKLAPVINALEQTLEDATTVNVTSAQHVDLLFPFIEHFALHLDYNLNIMAPGQTPNHVCMRILEAFDEVLTQENPDLLIVQGDTSTAMAGALAAFHRQIPVGHVEAGLRSGNPLSPFPEEMNRRLITRLATLHFAATAHNVDTLIAEGVSPERVILTGNPVVDSLEAVLAEPKPSDATLRLIDQLRGRRLLVVTTHRRESFGTRLEENLETLGTFVERHEDVVLVFPVHPNPVVKQAAHAHLGNRERIELIDPLGYFDFIYLLSKAWLIVSDSGGIQEESPTLGVPLLVIRENTERPEAIETGVARLVGGDRKGLQALLEKAYGDSDWARQIRRRKNPYGDGDSGIRIASAIGTFLRNEPLAQY